MCCKNDRKTTGETVCCNFVSNQLIPGHTHNTQLFYGSVEFVCDNPGELVPEETFTRTHSKL